MDGRTDGRTEGQTDRQVSRSVGCYVCTALGSIGSPSVGTRNVGKVELKKLVTLPPLYLSTELTDWEDGL
jgi:hypothetical protein